eukprot:846319-Prymnesium_polylepis.1
MRRSRSGRSPVHAIKQSITRVSISGRRLVSNHAMRQSSNQTLRQSGRGRVGALQRWEARAQPRPRAHSGW